MCKYFLLDLAQVFYMVALFGHVRTIGHMRTIMNIKGLCPYVIIYLECIHWTWFKYISWIYFFMHFLRQSVRTDEITYNAAISACEKTDRWDMAPFGLNKLGFEDRRVTRCNQNIFLLQTLPWLSIYCLC